MSPNLCENCRKRPKFGTHKFCGRTCAAQAAVKPAQLKQSQPQGKTGPRNATPQKRVPAQKKTVQPCIYCGQKPKFNGFDYCGKSCAALANATQAKPPATQGSLTTKQKTTRSSNTHSNNARAPSPAKPHKAPRIKAPVTQDESTEEDEGSEEEEEEEEEEEGAFTDLDAYPSDSGTESEDESSAPAVTAPRQGAKGMPKGGKLGAGTSGIAPGICAIPGCGQPSHVDRHGVKTNYCSIKHREEAVKLGLEPACIMCQRYPQSTSDYFCSSACKNQSMTKT